MGHMMYGGSEEYSRRRATAYAEAAIYDSGHWYDKNFSQAKFIGAYYWLVEHKHLDTYPGFDDPDVERLIARFAQR